MSLRALESGHSMGPEDRGSAHGPSWNKLPVDLVMGSTQQCLGKQSLLKGASLYFFSCSGAGWDFNNWFNHRGPSCLLAEPCLERGKKKFC